MINQNTSKSRSLSTLFIFTLLLVSLIPVSYIWGKPKRESSRGKREQSVDLDIFADEECNIKMKSIYWGEIEPGRNSTAVIYIKNRSKTPLTLTCSLSNFLPTESANYLSLDWDREGYLLEAHRTVEARLVLSVSSTDAIEIFSVDVLISGIA
jgi:hypothetical protein